MFTRPAIASLGLCIALSSAACEGGDSNDAPPRLMEGGGLGDGAIDGRVNIFVMDGDADGSEAVVGAEIFIGEAGEAVLQGSTDSSGLLTVKDSSLAGPTTISVVAEGFVTTTWYGANGANLTIPLSRRVERSDYGQATLRGTIDNWSALPEPATNHFVVAILGYSQTNELGNPANEIEQPVAAGLPPNACIRAAALTECDWSLVTRSGDLALSATIIDIDNKGTESDADDTSEVIGFAYQRGVSVVEGVTQTGLSLAMVATSAHQEVDFDIASLPSGVDSAGILLGIDLGAEGTMMLGFADIEDTSTLLAPTLSGDFSDASYRAYAFASNKADEEEDGRPTTAVLLRDIGDAASGIDFGEWMELPSALSVASDEFTFAATSQAALNTAEIRDGANDEVWSLVFLDGRTSFTLPALSSDPIGSGSFSFVVSSLDDPLDLQDFRIDDLSDTLARLATNRVVFTRQ